MIEKDSSYQSNFSMDYMARSRKTSSRLARKEEKRILQQSLIFGGLAVVVIIVFIFAVIPGLIKLTSLFVDNSSFSGPTDTIPPRPPTISSPPIATPSAELAVDGFSEPKSTVILVLNGEQADEVEADEDGTFNIVIPLIEDDNEIVFFAKDEAGNESVTSKTYHVVYDDIPPHIDIQTPEDGQSFELRKNQNITIKGETEQKAKVYLNDRLIFTNSDGSFNGTFQLAEGDNPLTIKAVDQAGNTAEKTISVSFRL